MKPKTVIPEDLAPESKEILERASELGLLDAEVATVEEMRELSLLERELMAPPPAVARVEEVEISTRGDPVRVRIYTPAGEPPFPTILHIHGGGWVIGGLDHSDVDCRCLAVDTGALVVSVEYRLAPEHPFPQGLEDAYAAASWVAAEIDAFGGDPASLTVGGDSAGGNLAAAVCLVAADRGGPSIAHQLLIYPVTDCSFETESYRRYSEGYWLELDGMREFWRLYMGGRDTADPLASVLRAPDVSALPPATIVVAECDVLRDEAEAYGDRLRVAGVPTNVWRYEGQLHGFWSCGGARLPREVNARIAGALAPQGLASTEP